MTSRKPTRGAIPAAGGDSPRKPPAPPARRPTRDEPLPPPIARRPTAEVELAADLDLSVTNVQRLDELQPPPDADRTSEQKLSELYAPPDADQTNVQRLSDLYAPPDADRTNVQRLDALLPPPPPDRTSVQRLAELADVPASPERLAPPIAATPWADGSEHPAPPDDPTNPRAYLPVPPDDPTNPRAFVPAPPDDPTNPRAYLPVPPDEPTNPRAELPAPPDDPTHPRASVPELRGDVTNPQAAAAALVPEPPSNATAVLNLAELPANSTAVLNLAELPASSTAVLSLEQLAAAPAEAPSASPPGKVAAPAQGNPAPLIVAAIGLCAAVMGLGLLLVGDETPGRMDLEAVYPYGVHGYVAPDGRAAPAALDVVFTLEGREPCMSGGSETCFVYRYAYQGFSGTMRVRQDGEAWVRVGDKGMPFPIVKPGQQRLEAAELTPRGRELRDEEFANHPEGRALNTRKW